MENRWYVVRTFSGHENKVKSLLEAGLVDHENLKAKIVEILVPMENRLLISQTIAFSKLI